jgi:hypothetical protein
LAEVGGIVNLIELGRQNKVFTLLLPFLLAWILYYFALDEADFLFPENMDNFPPVVALILASFTVVFLYLQPWYQDFFWKFFGNISIALTGLLGLLTLLGFAGYQKSVIKRGVFVVFLLALAGTSFLVAGGFGPPAIQGMSAYGIAKTLAIWTIESGAVWLLAIGAIMWYVARGTGDSSESTSILHKVLDTKVDEESLNSD